MNIYEQYMDRALYFYRYSEDGHRKQRSFDDLMGAVKFCLEHTEHNQDIKNPVIVDSAGQTKFVPRTIK